MRSLLEPEFELVEIVEDGVDKPRMKELVATIRNDVASGSGLAPSLAKHPRHFDDLFCNLVEAGEQAGVLDTLLDKIASEVVTPGPGTALRYCYVFFSLSGIVLWGLCRIKRLPQAESALGACRRTT